MEKSSRPVRNRRHSRRTWPPGDTHRPIKRLFTPEIKRLLKDWLIRRRDNPYPSRDEKKTLAHDTGLTYTQICNWFANWRRKLKNSGREPTKKTWGHLIKNYNTNAKGNVEQFSICSSDSIWGDEECSRQSDNVEDKDHPYALFNNNTDYISNEYENDANNYMKGYFMDKEIYRMNETVDHCYTPRKLVQPQCFQVSSTTDDQMQIELNNCNATNKVQQQVPISAAAAAGGNTKYKQQMMEKYLRDTSESSSNSNPELSKWLESAAKFTPDKHSYIEWSSNSSPSRQKTERKRTKTECNNHFENAFHQIHQKEELDAAEALTNLAGNYRQRLINSASYAN